MTWVYFSGFAVGVIAGVGIGQWTYVWCRAEWSRQLAEATERADGYAAAAVTLLKERNQARADLAGCRRHNADADAEILALTAKLEAAEALDAAVADERDALAAAGLSAGDALESAKAATDRLVAERDELREVLSAAWSQVGGANASVHARSRDLQKAAAQLSDVTKTRDELRATVDALDAACVRLANERDAAVKAAVRVRDEAADVRHQQRAVLLTLAGQSLERLRDAAEAMP